MCLESDLFGRVKKGDLAAKARLFQDNTGLIWACIKRYAGLLEKEDLFQLGAIGLLKAIDRFDPHLGTAFSTYAVPLILGEIRGYLRDDGPIKIARRLKEVSMAAKDLSLRKKQATGREPTVEEVARGLEVDVDLLCRAMEASQTVLYFEEFPHGFEEGAIFSKDASGSDVEALVDEIDIKDAIAKLNRVMQIIIFGRFFLGKTQQEIAGELRLSQAHVSRLEKKALLFLRRILRPGS